MQTRPVLRIFVSSTAADLLEYREKVRDVVLGLKNLPIAMETFSAKSGAPVDECMKEAAAADALVCVVAHRYGYVPPKELGGDGERSITWLEVDAAKKAGKPVFAFLVDPNAPWTAAKEQDRLLTERERTAEILRAIDKLQEFKKLLSNEKIFRTFKSPDDLATEVAITLHHFAPEQSEHAPTSITRVWTPLFCHTLQPAPHFRGRAAHLTDLKTWLQSPVTPDRVLSVVAAGGTGKTALVDRALQADPLPDRAGAFVWSFYEDPHIDAFFRAACQYFTGRDDLAAGGLIERLRLALSGDLPHILILDGLERVQSEGDHRRRGELEDLQLKRFIVALAGGMGNARALVTSRSPLVDLDDWKGAGHRAIVLDDLERQSALEVLRGWEVKGDDDALARLIEPLNVNGLYHALSVAVLGSYAGNFPGAPQFSIEDAKDSEDPKARRLHRILEQYTKALTGLERDLLARLSLFPRGVKVEILGWIVQSGGDVAGALIGLGDSQLVKHLQRLKALGLVFGYEADRQIVYSAHPFLREFFRGLLGARPESVHESVRAKLAPSLESRPSVKPGDTAILDQYELLIEQTLLAGKIQEAFDLYWYGMGGYGNLSKSLGENARALRILERFVPGGDFAVLEGRLRPGEQSALVNALGLYAVYLGNLARARPAFEFAARHYAAQSDAKSESRVHQNLVELELTAGRFPDALAQSEKALECANKSKEQTQILFCFAYRAQSGFALGDLDAAKADFERATGLEGKGLFGRRGIAEAESKLLLGDRTGARQQTIANRQICDRNHWNDDACRCDALLARLCLPDDPAQTAQHLGSARAFANRSGDVEIQLRCFHAATELYRHLGDHTQSITEAESGILLADTCGFGKYSIDLRIALAETWLAAGDPHKALQNARNALDRSEHPDCQYAWGKADGLHFCGIAHLRLNEPELARQRLTAALELREKLQHGRIEETRAALRELDR